MKQICVIGLGYIGLPTAAIFATHGYRVLGVDVDQDVLDVLNHGDIHIEEPGLKTLVRAAVNSGNLRVQSEPEESDVFIIAVPTPITEKKSADLSYVKTATRAVAKFIRSGDLVVLEATSPPRTTIDLVQPILETSGLVAGEDFLLTYSPERVLPGKILHELVHNSRVIGGINRKSAIAGRDLYQSFVEGDIILTDATTAEMVKLMENTYRDINIAAANEFSRLSVKFQVNIWEAIEIANLHPRVEILQPGPGVGGHCISVDPWFFVEKAPEASQLIRKARDINDEQPEFVVNQLQKEFPSLEGKVFAALGVTYKKDVGDLRESPAIEVIRSIQETGGEVKAYDPNVSKPPAWMKYLRMDLEEALFDVDGILLLVDHKQFMELAPEKIVGFVKQPFVFDTRNCLDKEQWREAGFKVLILGDGKDG